MEEGQGMHKWNIVYEEGHMTLTPFDSTNRFTPTSSINLTQAMFAAGASEVHAQRWNGCYLNGDCNRHEMTRVRFSVRKGAKAGTTCSRSWGPAQTTFPSL
ncbi:unnamed protein product [Polarella glacialis]|uniref:Uncharacterized protein n=1 Tax=Polarella glacialis TaxID=89957 RepID=A0A813JPK8_POLGL|nr:unnamed protein product [Polarella glacialis]CAE8683831.1 unnamed protein product [Polarella glacialis]